MWEFVNKPDLTTQVFEVVSPNTSLNQYMRGDSWWRMFGDIWALKTTGFEPLRKNGWDCSWKIGNHEMGMFTETDSFDKPKLQVLTQIVPSCKQT